MRKINVILSLLVFVGVSLAAENTKFALTPLPYALNALEPYISGKTLELHHDKHHQGYVDKLNELVVGKSLEGKTLEEIILLSAHNPEMVSLFNNAAQDWNHSFYWRSMKAQGGGQPQGKLLEAIKKDFGSYEEFRKQFIDAGMRVFGSGWVWLVMEGETLKITATANADLPLLANQTALLVCDVWEHAYYLDYQNRRRSYVEIFLDHLVNWDFALINMG